MNRVIRTFLGSFMFRISIVFLLGAISFLAPHGGAHAQMKPHAGRVSKFHLVPHAKLRQMVNPYCGGYNPPPPNQPPVNPPNPGGGGTGVAVAGTAISQSGETVTGAIPSQAMNSGLQPGDLGMSYGRVGCLSVWTNSNYYQGYNTPVYACYTVPGPWLTELDLWHFTSQWGFTAWHGYDDGTGGCGLLGTTGVDTGWRALTVKVWTPYGQMEEATTYYYVDLGFNDRRH